MSDQQTAPAKKRILDAIHHRPVDRIPTDFWATVEIQERLCDYFGIDTGNTEPEPYIGLNGGPLSRRLADIERLLEYLKVDCILNVRPPYIGPAVEARDGMTMNEWGFGYRDKAYGTGTYTEQVFHPLAEATTVDDVDSYRWPDPDWYDYDALPALIDRCRGHAVTVGYAALFTYHNYLRGLERSLMDPMLYPEMTHRIIERLSEFFYEYHTRCFKAAGDRIDTHQVTDDWGSQTGLIVSPTVFREFYKEHTGVAIDLAKTYAIKVLHHDDGDCRTLLPELVELGIDILNPVQYRCGNWDLRKLKDDYGTRVCFHSAVDNQEVLPRGTIEDVRGEVRMLIDTLGADRTGFILGSCHNLQPNTPVENIVAMYDEAYRYG